MKRLAAALFGILATLAVVTAPPASANNIQVSGNVLNTDAISVYSGEVSFFATCADFDSGVPVATAPINNVAYSLALPAGTYRVFIVPGSDSPARTSWNGGFDTCAESTAITVDADNTFHPLFAAKATLTSFSVKTDLGTNPMTGSIEIYRTCKAYNNNNPVATAAFTNASVNIPLVPGDYRVLIVPGPGTGAITSWHDASANCAGSDLVSIPDAQITSVDAVAIGTSGLAGAVVSDRGPVQDGFVQFYKTCNDAHENQSTAFAVIDNGSYSTDIPPGTYRARITPFDTSGAMESWHDDQATCATSTPITVVNTQLQTEDLEAQDGVFLTGSVTLLNGDFFDDVSGALYFYNQCDGSGRYVSINGLYYETLLPTGSYRVAIDPGQNSNALESWHSAAGSCADATEIEADADKTVDLLFRKGSAISGTVSTSNGPVNAGSVTFYTSCDAYADRRSSTSVAVSNGGYAATLADGTYRVLIEPDGGKGALESWHNAKRTCVNAATITVNGNTTANLTAIAGANVTGTVSTANGPLNSGAVTFYATCEDFEADDPAARANFGPNYAVSVPAGTYRVLIQPQNSEPGTRSWHNAKSSCADATTVTVSGNTTLNLIAAAGSQVGGAVTSSAGPVDAGYLAFYATCEDFVDENPTRSVAITAGTYSAKVPNGTYRVRIDPGQTTTAGPSWHSATASCANADVVTVNGNNPSLDLTALAGYDVDGIVTRSGEAFTFGDVEFFASCEDFTADQRIARAEIFNGTFSTHLGAGTYYARITAFAGNSSSYSWHNEATSCAGATPITIQGPADLDLKALPTSIVDGIVSGPSGQLDDGYLQFFATCEDYATGDSVAETSFTDYGYKTRLPDGTYLARIVPYNDAAAARSWHNAAGTCAQATAITVAGSGTHNLIAAGGVAVTGTVSSSNGPVKGGELDFYTSCGALNSDTRAARATIRSNGYTTRIVPGTYRVAIEVDSGYGALTSWHSAKSSCADATLVTVSGDGTVDLVARARTNPVIPTPPPSPEPTVTPTPEPTVTVLGSQSAKKPPAKLKKGKKNKLATKTTQGAKLTWKTSTKKVCTVKKTTVTAKKKGTCKLSAKAPAVTGFNAFSKRYTIKVK